MTRFCHILLLSNEHTNCYIMAENHIFRTDLYTFYWSLWKHKCFHQFSTEIGLMHLFIGLSNKRNPFAIYGGANKLHTNLDRTIEENQITIIITNTRNQITTENK